MEVDVIGKVYTMKELRAAGFRLAKAEGRGLVYMRKEDEAYLFLPLSNGRVFAMMRAEVPKRGEGIW